MDIYSLGILVFSLIRDAQPSRDFETLSKFRRSESQFSQLVEIKENDWCSRELREFINHCLRRDPDQRPTAKQLMDYAWVKKCALETAQYLES